MHCKNQKNPQSISRDALERLLISSKACYFSLSLLLFFQAYILDRLADLRNPNINMSWEDTYKPQAPKKASKAKVPPPFGYEERMKMESKASGKDHSSHTVRNYDIEKLRVKKAWELAYLPAKNIPMNLIMSYFSPSTLQLIPIMMTLTLFTNPLKDILTVNSKFDSIELDEEKTSKTGMKLLYVLCSLGTVAVGIWKLNSMGLIPNSSSDWLAWEEPDLSSNTFMFI